MTEKILEKELQEQICCLEKVLAQITTTKTNLAQNAHQAKSRIHTVMSRQLETLRSREVWLLQQVDLLADTKDGVLWHQAEELHAALGALQACVACLEAGDSADLDIKIKETLESLEKLDLQPLESPHLSFKADLAKLREAVHQFGKVDSLNLPIDMVFAREAGCSSLPCAFEDYEDDEHHLMYKTVQEIQRQDNCTQRVVSFTAPNLSCKPSDWLFLPQDVQPPTPVKVTFPPFQSADLSEWLVGASKESVQQWLHDIQVQGDMEEDAVGLSPLEATLESPSPNSIEVLSLPHSGWLEIGDASTSIPPISTQVFPYFQQVATAPCETWLQDQQGCSKSTTYEIMEYFRDMSKSTKAWLQQIEEEKEEQKPVSDCCGGNRCSSTSAVPQYEIEELDLMQCATDPMSKYLTQVSSDPHSWLQEQGSEKDVDERELAITQGINQLCKANETCKTFIDCLCEENCANKLVKMGSMSDTAKAWLMEPKNPDVVSDFQHAPIFEYFSLITNDKPSDWLVPVQAKGVPVETNVSSNVLFPPFGHTTTVNQWLLSSAIVLPCPTTTQCPFFQNFVNMKSAETLVWIKSPEESRDNPSADITSPVFSFTTSSTDMRQWLLKGSDDVTPMTPKVNPWLLSTPDSAPSYSSEPASTEQFFDHLNNVNTEYKWVIAGYTEESKFNDKPLSKNCELPESNNKEDGKWLLVVNKDDIKEVDRDENVN